MSGPSSLLANPIITQMNLQSSRVDGNSAVKELNRLHGEFAKFMQSNAQNQQLLATDNLKGMGASPLSISLQEFLNEGHQLEHDLSKAASGEGGLEETAQKMAKYVAELEVYKNLIDSGVTAIKSVTVNMQL